MIKKMTGLMLGLCVVSFLWLPIASAEFSPKWGASADFIGFFTSGADASRDRNSITPPVDTLAARAGLNSNQVESIELEARLFADTSLTKNSNAYLGILAIGGVQGAAAKNTRAAAGTNPQQIAILLQEAYYHFNDGGFDVSFGIQGGKTGTFGRNYWHGINFGFNPDKGGASALVTVPHPRTNAFAVAWTSGGIHNTPFRHVNGTTNATPSAQVAYSFGEMGKEGFNGKVQGFFAYPVVRVVGGTKAEVTYAGFYGGVGYGLTDSLGINVDGVVSQYRNYESAANATATLTQPDLADNYGGGLQVLFDLNSDVALTAGAMVDKSSGFDGAIAGLRRNGALGTAVIGGDFKNACIGDKLFCLGSTGVFWQQTLNGRGVAVAGVGQTNRLARLPDISHLHGEIEHSWLWRWATTFAADNPAGPFGNGRRSYVKVDGTFDVGHTFDWGVMGEHGRQQAALLNPSLELGWGLTGSLGTKVGPVKLALVSSLFNVGLALGSGDTSSHMLTVGF